jgi:hypothetical protein
MPSIVTVNVTQQVAPIPATLQRIGAFVSQGGTVLAPGSSALLTQPSDLTPLLTASGVISSLVWAAQAVTVTTLLPHGFPIGDQMTVIIRGANPVGFDGTFLVNVTGASTFVYPLGFNPGAVVVAGFYAPLSQRELVQMTNTFFAQGVDLSVYVLELGPGGADIGSAALGAYLTQNPNTAYTSGSTGFFYRYLVPRPWDGDPSFLNLVQQYDDPTSRTYFHVTTTLSNYVNYTDLEKSVFALIESPIVDAYPANALTAITWSNGVVTATTTVAHGVLPGTWFQIQGCVPTAYNGYWLALPGTVGATLFYSLATNPGVETTLGTLVASLYTNPGVPPTEFTSAWPFWAALHYNPSPTNRVAPFAFKFGFGVTPFPTRGFSALLSQLLASGINYAGTGAEGGSSNVILRNGTTADGRPLTYWYSVDWAQVNSDLELSNAVINGDNDSVNPLLYNQDGINRLQGVEVGVMNSAITFGLANGTVVTSALDQASFNQALLQGKFAGQIVVNAVPFASYVSTNPSDYPAGIYAGLSVNYIVQNGFVSIVFNLNVTDFLT